MKKIFFYICLLFFVSCDKFSTEDCPFTGLPPASFQVFVSNENLHAQDFLDSKGGKDEAVYFYKLTKDNATQIRYETSLFSSLSANTDNNGFYLSFEEWEKALATGNLETIYLNNKGKTDIIQIKIVYIEQRCDSYYLCEELIINGEKRKAGFPLYRFINLEF